MGMHCPDKRRAFDRAGNLWHVRLRLRSFRDKGGVFGALGTETAERANGVTEFPALVEAGGSVWGALARPFAASQFP